MTRDKEPRDYIELVKRYGTPAKAIRGEEIAKSTFYDGLKNQKKAQSANRLGLNFCEVEEVIPEGQFVKATSIMYDADGNKKLQWIKTDQEQIDKETRFQSILEGLIDDIPKVAPKDYTHIASTNLCSAYIISDFHLGQFSSATETKDAWTLDSAFDCIINWFGKATAAAPHSKQAVLVDLGDFLHADGILPCTPSSGHVLDVDGRFRDVADMAITIFDYAIQALLDKHENVHVLIAEGNHNIDSSYWTTLAVSRRYEDEPRVTFDFSKTPYYAFQWGNTSLFFHHGHKKRIADVSRTLAGKFREIYGSTKYSYAHVGHMHHRELKECALMVVEQHSTLAAKDAHSERGGYSSERGASVINYHRDFGEVGRSCIRPEMLL